MKVIEVVDGEGKEGYAEGGIVVSYPKDSPTEGIVGATDMRIYTGTVDAFSQEIVNRLVTQYPEDW
jgi:hypothetical protein